MTWLRENWLALLLLAAFIVPALWTAYANGVNSPCPRCGYRATLWGK